MIEYDYISRPIFKVKILKYPHNNAENNDIYQHVITDILNGMIQ